MNTTEASEGQMTALLTCESANPEWTSVPLEGWSHAQALARVTRAHRVTQIRNRAAFLRAGVAQDEFTSIDSEAVARRMRRAGELVRGGANRGWTTLQALSTVSYAYYEHLFWQRFGADIRRGRYDIVHRITPLSPTTPSSLAARCDRAGVPFILGPLNGGVPWPRAFDRERRREREWLSYIREAYRLLPGYRSTRRHAAAIICGSLDTLRQMPAGCHDRCIYIPENAIDPTRFADAERYIQDRPPPLPLRLAFVGRLVPYKGADMLIHAAAPLLREGKVTLDIIGDGPELPHLRDMVRREAVTDSVQLRGWVKHTALQEALAEAHVFAFPSIREFGGAVVLEAMALGLVPVVVNYGGPGELVTEETGHRIPIGDRAHIVAEFRRTLESLVDQASSTTGAAELAAMAERGRARTITHFTWEAKAHQVLEVYRWVKGQRDRPEFQSMLNVSGVAAAIEPRATSTARSTAASGAAASV